MQEKIPSLKERIIQDEKMVEIKIAELEEEWKNKKPERALNVKPADAINLINVLEGKAHTTNDDWIRICRAKELLDMDLAHSSRLEPFLEDIELYKEVWHRMN